MKLRALSTVGVGAVGLALVSAASPAAAAPNCGPVPAGATLTVLPGNTCQLDFAAAGSFNWTLPAGLSGLQALLVGGGTGAVADGGGVGYAGSSGSVAYADYSAATPGDAAVIVVGAGGVSDDTIPTEGGDSSTDINSVATVADGGDVGITSYCSAEGDSTFSGNGNGAGQFFPGVFTGDCEDDYAEGLNPSVDPTDSYSTPFGAAFANLNVEYARGGRVLVTSAALTPDAALAGTGQGADVHYDSVSGTFPEFNAVGGGGRVILRFQTSAIAPALAATGVEAAPVLTIAALTAGLGAVFLATARRRKRA